MLFHARNKSTFSCSKVVLESTQTLLHRTDNSIIGGALCLYTYHHKNVQSLEIVPQRAFALTSLKSFLEPFPFFLSRIKTIFIDIGMIYV